MADLPRTCAQGRFTVGDAVYPSTLDAPDWHWEKSWKGEDWEWVEMNRPEPLYIEIHPNFDDTEAMVDPADYPPNLQKAVRAFNRLFEGRIRNAFSRGTASALFYSTILADHADADRELSLYRASEGYTKQVNLGDCGFVPHGKEAHLTFGSMEPR